MMLVDQQHPADPTRADGRSADGRLGDCLRACLATVTGLPYDQVPHFAEHADWWGDLRRWARETIGYDVGTLVPVAGRVQQFIGDTDPADFVAIACGPSPRRHDARHAVIVDGNLDLLHDPHPSRHGLDQVHELYVLVPIGDLPAPEPAGG